MLTISELPSRPMLETFPGDGSLREKLAYVAGYAESAPELFGVRPWSLVVTGSGIEVHLERSLRLKSADSDGRESTIAAGAALFFLRLALRCHLLESEIVHAHSLDERSLVARLTVVGRASPSPSELEMFAILTGEPGETISVPPLDVLAPDLQEIGVAAREEGAVVRYVQNDFLRDATISMLQAGDLLHYHAEEQRNAFRSWLGVTWDQAPRSGTSEFVTWEVASHELSEALHGSPHQSGALPAIAVICTDHDDEENWLKAGLALGHIHLLTSALGMCSTVFNQPLQVPGMRARFARETGFRNFPQVVVRVGYGGTSNLRRRRIHDELSRHLIAEPHVRV